MCQNLRPFNKAEFIGYKVVARDGDRYRSILTGNLYPKDGRIPIWKTQDKALAPFCRVLTPKSIFYRKKMVGATGAFNNRADAERYLRTLYIVGKVTLCILQVKLTKKLMSGNLTICSFSPDVPIVIGRHMKILEVVA